MAFNLGVGGNQHYSAVNRRYFTNIVANAVDDLDGDGFDDIVLLANAIPQNNAYSNTRPLPTYQYSHYCVGSTSVFSPSGTYWQGEFLDSGDYLFNRDSVIPARPNEQWLKDFWDTGDAGSPTVAKPELRGFHRFDTLFFAPPSPNVVAGLVDGYTGSDLAWLKGDGRGNFQLMFITPLDTSGTRQPARIRMGTAIRLARLRDTAGPGLDILLISRSNFVANSPSATVYADSTTIEPFTGASRVMWLENKGWNGGILDFEDHGIAEYNYDRLPVVFYAGYQNVSGGWNGPAVTLDPIGVDVMDVDSDGRNDILVTNLPSLNSDKGATDLLYSAADTRMDPAFLDAHYSPRLPRPKDGDRWAANEELWPWSPGGVPRTFFWYKNDTTLPQFSTDTYRQALNMSSAGFTETVGKMTRLRLAGGQDAFVSVLSGTAKIFRRFGSLLQMNLRATDTQIDTALIPGARNAFAGNVDGADGDELIVDYFTGTGGYYDRFKIFRITDNGGTDISISELFSFTFVGRHASDQEAGRNNAIYTVADLNKDNLGDIIVPHFGKYGHETAPATILMNRTTGGSVNFQPLLQTKPELLLSVSDVINRYSQMGYGGVDISLAVSTGDFNGDGFTDFVRTGPNLPATLFINNFQGLQRARITTSVQHDTGTTKTWTVIQGGQIDATGGVDISVQPAGGIGVESVLTQ